MGYRSDVGIALGFKTKEACDKFILTYKLKKPEFWREIVEEHWERADERVLVGYYECVKWNRGYDDVDAIHDMFEWANSNHDASYRVVRIGEDYDDVEIEEYCHDAVNLYLHEFVDIQRDIHIKGGQTLE